MSNFMKTGKITFVEVDDEPFHKEEYKNEYIRIYSAKIEPGKSTEFHRHSKDTIYIVFKGGKIRTERMKGTHSCPTYLPEIVPLSMKLLLVIKKILFKYLTLDMGFIFFMPSKKYPVIHKAMTSYKNKEIMNLLGIEILYAADSKFCLSKKNGRKEIEAKEMIINRINLKYNQSLNESCSKQKSLIVSVTGKVEIICQTYLFSLYAGDYYWANEGSIQMIKNPYKEQVKIIQIIFKNA